MKKNKDCFELFMLLAFLSTMAIVCMVLSGCVTVKHTAGQRGTPYFWTERTTVIGTAEIQRVAQNFQGNLSVSQGANGPEVLVGLTSGQNAEGIKTTELEALSELIKLLNNLSKLVVPF